MPLIYQFVSEIILQVLPFMQLFFTILPKKGMLQIPKALPGHPVGS
jgi:hypothetical protein